MRIECDNCKKEFKYIGGLSHFNRTKTHCCSIECAAKLQEKHGMSRRIDKGTPNGKIYQIYSNAKKRSKKLNIDFNIDLTDIKIPKICPILGIELKLDNQKFEHNSPSIDRIDNSKGYIKGNIVIISDRANRMKRDSTFEEIERLYK